MATTIGSASKLLTSPIPVNILRENARNELDSLLDSLPGTKLCLVIEPKLVPILKLLITEGASSWMKDHRVDAIVELTTASLFTSCETVLYITRPTIPTMKLIAQQTKMFDKKGLRKKLSIAFLPRRTFICEQVLKEEGVFADLSTVEWSMDMIPLDDDILTMGFDHCFYETYVQHDHTSLFILTRALLKIQNMYGLFPSVKAKGPKAKAVIDMFLRLQREEDGRNSNDGGMNGGGNRRPNPNASSSSSSSSGKNNPDGNIDGLVIYVGAKGVNLGGNSSIDPSTGAPLSSTGTATSGSTNDTLPLKSEIDMLVLLDRGIDLVTPLVSPLTVESLLHEFLGIENSMMQIDASLIQEPPAEDDPTTHSPNPTTATPSKTKALPPGTKLTLHVNSNDKLYAEIRDLNISTAGPHLQARAREIREFRDQLKNSKQLQVGDIRKFVKAIPTLQNDEKSLRLFVELITILQKQTNDTSFVNRWQLERGLLEEENSKEIQDYLTSLIAKRSPLVPLLRLLCLNSVIEGGLKSKTYENLRKDLVSMYGFGILQILDTLEKTGLLSTRDSGIGSVFTGGSTAPWTSLRKTLSLLTDDAKVDAPTDIHFVTSGYAPLSIRLIQAAVTTGWNTDNMNEALKNIPGATIQFTQVRRNADNSNGENSGGSNDGNSRKVVLVTFIGGITYIEISALRFLAEKYPVDFIVLTTSIINGNTFLSSIINEGNTSSLDTLLNTSTTETVTPNANNNTNVSSAASVTSSASSKTAPSTTSGTSSNKGGSNAAATGKGSSSGSSGNTGKPTTSSGLFGFGGKK